MKSTTPHYQRSAVSQPGGKWYSLKHILSELPHHAGYRTWCEVFCGSAVLTLNKPRNPAHLEIVNDANTDLVNFWLQCRDYPAVLQKRLDSLPYSRWLYTSWHTSLFDGTEMSSMERAVRWFYVLRGSLGCYMRSASSGNWGYEVTDAAKSAITYRNVTELFAVLSERLKHAQIECGSYESIIKRYERPDTLFYCDPPYIGSEKYYDAGVVDRFSENDHRQLATLLNATPAKVALSYYPHPLIDELYPTSRWRRITWQVWKSVEKTQKSRQSATEMLLCNYAEERPNLWSMPH